MPLYTFGTQAVYDPISDKVVENATGGQLVEVKDGPALPIWDLNGQPLAFITSNGAGQSSQFKADKLRGLIQFGEVVVTAWANEVADLIDETLSAQADAAQAVQTALQAQAAADAAVARVEDYIAGGGTGGGGGLPVGTTLQNIPDGTTRLAMAPAERTRIAALPATFLQVGTTATTAMAGNRTFTAAQVGAVANMGGFPGIVGRTASQGLPSAAELAALPPGTYIAVDQP